MNGRRRCVRVGPVAECEAVLAVPRAGGPFPPPRSCRAARIGGHEPESHETEVREGEPVRARARFFARPRRRTFVAPQSRSTKGKGGSPQGTHAGQGAMDSPPALAESLGLRGARRSPRSEGPAPATLRGRKPSSRVESPSTHTSRRSAGPASVRRRGPPRGSLVGGARDPFGPSRRGASCQSTPGSTQESASLTAAPPGSRSSSRSALR
jgi:hypothetical protein